MAMPSGHLSGGRDHDMPASDQDLGDQSLLGGWLEHGSGQKQSNSGSCGPRWEGASRVSGGCGLVWLARAPVGEVLS